MVSDATKRITQFSQLSQTLASAPDEDARLKLVVESASTLLAKVAHAGITVNHERELITKVSSDDVVLRANEIQSELGEGPCLDVHRDQNTVIIPDLAVEDRWPAWARRVHDELEVGSMMSLLVYNDRQSFGALSLYAERGEHFDADDVAVGQALAGQLAVTIAAEREIDQLGLAMHNRLLIGQAQGILMARLDISAPQAFDYLRRVSMNSNRKVIDLAAEVASTRALPTTSAN